LFLLDFHKDDYKEMVLYGITVKIINEIFPCFVTVLVIAIIIASVGSGLGGIVAFMIVLDVIYLVLSLYGSY
jgi:hypothetical protein